MSGGSGSGRGKGKGKGEPSPWEVDPNAWEGGLGPKEFGEAEERFPVESKYAFSNENPVQNYKKRKDPWPQCMHGEDCLLQMYTEGFEGGRRFWRCPRAWVISITYFVGKYVPSLRSV